MVTVRELLITAVTGCPPSRDGLVTGSKHNPSHRFPNPGQPVTPGARCGDVTTTRHNLPAGKDLVTGVTGCSLLSALTRAHAHAISVNRRCPSHPSHPVQPATAPSTQATP